MPPFCLRIYTIQRKGAEINPLSCGWKTCDDSAFDVNFDEPVGVAELLLVGGAGAAVGVQEIHLPVVKQIYVRGGTVEVEVLVVLPGFLRIVVDRLSQNRETEVHGTDRAGVGGGSGQPFFLRGNGRPFQYAGLMRLALGDPGNRNPDPFVDIVIGGVGGIGGVEGIVARRHERRSGTAEGGHLAPGNQFVQKVSGFGEKSPPFTVFRNSDSGIEDPPDGDPVVEVVGIGVEGEAVLLQIVQATGAFCRLPRPVQCRQQQSRQNGDDRDYHEKFYKRKFHMVSMLHDYVAGSSPAGAKLLFGCDERTSSGVQFHMDISFIWGVIVLPPGFR